MQQDGKNAHSGSASTGNSSIHRGSSYPAPKNYAALVRKDVPANPESIGTVLTVKQIRSLLDVAPFRYNDDGKPVCERGQHLRSRFEPVYLITLLLGLRKGEAVGLHWDGIDFDASAMCQV
jgi:hypothetical protein